MKQTITMTSKGTFTLPLEVRRKLGVNAQGDKLLLEFDEQALRATISKPKSFAELQKFVQTHTKSDQPLPKLSRRF